MSELAIITGASIAVAADHGGFRLKQAIAAQLRALGHAVLDFGVHNEDRADYPDYAHPACAAVLDGRATFAVLVCGTGIGMSLAANRNPGIRCALVSEATSAGLARAHNNANALALGGRMIAEAAAFDILRAFLATPYEGGRHDARLAKLLPANPTPPRTEPA